jgi:hypothetical protein
VAEFVAVGGLRIAERGLPVPVPGRQHVYVCRSRTTAAALSTDHGRRAIQCRRGSEGVVSERNRIGERCLQLPVRPRPVIRIDDTAGVARAIRGDQGGIP